jgi:hypothetical protein
MNHLVAPGGGVQKMLAGVIFDGGYYDLVTEKSKLGFFSSRV